MTLKELNTYMREQRIPLALSQRDAVESLGLEVEYYASETLPPTRDDILLTSEPVAGEVLLQLHRAHSRTLLIAYETTSGDFVNICKLHLMGLFGTIPDFLYVTKVKGETK